MSKPLSPAALIQQRLGQAGVTVTEFASAIGVNRVSASRLLNGVWGIGPDMALKLEGALGGTAEEWLRLQCARDLAIARAQRRPKVRRLKA